MLARSVGWSAAVFAALSALAIVLLWGYPFHPGTADEAGVSTSTLNPRDTQIKQLLSLGYITTVDIDEADRGKSNVTGHFPARAYENINVYCPEDTDTAYFMDMCGNILHSIKTGEYETCILLEIIDENNFLMLMNKNAVVSMDWDSDVNWVASGVFHHDIDVAEDGDIYALREELVNMTNPCQHGPIRDNYLTILTPDGKIKKEVSFAGLISKNKPLLKSVDCSWGEDIFHVNTLEIVSRDVYAGDKRLFKKGDVLVCIRNMNLIAVVDLEKEEFTWYWGEGVLDGPHQPSLQDDGKILVFDNGLFRMYSRLIELDPATGEIEWEYTAEPPESFYTNEQGGVQQLPNGNLLVTESGKGHIFEITRKGELAWEFWNPPLSHAGDQRKSIYRMSRLTAGFRNLSNCQSNATPTNPSICNRIAEGRWRDRCSSMAPIAGAEEVCAGIQDENESDTCLRDVGVALDNSLLCERIGNQREADRCYMDIGVEIKSAILCGKIHGQTEADLCYRDVGIARRSYLMCDKVTGREDADICYSAVGIALVNVTLCDLVQTQEPADRCYERVGHFTGNQSLCDRIVSSGYADKCYSRVGVKLGDASLCGMVRRQSAVDDCYGDIAVASKDPLLCDKITDQTGKDKCYKNVAASTKDTALCDLILEQWRRDSCRKDAGK